MARPTKLTPELQAKLLKLIEQGVTQQVAALNSGISAATFYNWQERGRKAKSGVYRKFVDALAESQAKAEATLVLRMRMHANSNYKAAAWILERRFPDRWKERKEVEQTGGPVAHGIPFQLVADLSNMTNEQLAALAVTDLDALDEASKPTPDDDKTQDTDQ